MFFGGRHSSADNDKPPVTVESQPAPSRASETAAPADEDGPKQTSPRVLFGPGGIQFQTSAYGVDIDLDSSKPLVADSLKGADLTAIADVSGTADSTSFHGGPRLAAMIAPISGGRADPTEAQCAEALQSNGDPLMESLPQDGRFCVQTTEGRTAFVRVTSAVPGGHTMKVMVTVWDLAT